MSVTVYVTFHYIVFASPYLYTFDWWPCLPKYAVTLTYHVIIVLCRCCRCITCLNVRTLVNLTGTGFFSLVSKVTIVMRYVCICRSTHAHGSKMCSNPSETYRWFHA